MNRYNLSKRITPGVRKDVYNMISSPKTANKSAIGTPQFPAFNSNMSMQDVRKFINMQPRITGVPFIASLGQFTINNIQLPGDARLLLGVIFTTGSAVTDTFTMTLNNNKIIDNASIQLNSQDNGPSITTGYFEFLQPLTGKDVFRFDLFTSGLTGTLQLHFI